MPNNTAVYGIYSDRTVLEEAVESIKEAGFRITDISVLRADNVGSKDFAHEKHTKAPEAAVAGGGAGVLVGGTLGWLASIGSLALPGIGAFASAGPIMGVLAGVGVGGFIGSIIGGLSGIGFPEYEAKRSRVEQSTEESYSRCIARIPNGSSAPSKS